ncbi:Alpha N-terminal protein methyltransferase 1 [Myotisia sp. PD_48]|nr:Alpha N-terminal protein methyltransferase 1 [Myotisia sp. PD_48]
MSMADQVAPDSRIDHASAIRHWNSVTPDDNGMLGGYAQISNVDLRGSSAFLAKVRRLIPSIGASKAPLSPSSPVSPFRLGVDCGAGVGRITKGFLSRVCEVVDIVEPVETFAKVIRDGDLNAQGKIGDIYVTGLEAWNPTKKYDLIWNQWCLGHLTDGQLVDYLQRCKKALSDSGLVVIKENMRYSSDEFDELDNSVTRTEQKFKDLFLEAGYTILHAEEQMGIPQRLNLYPVKIFALRPPRPKQI